MGIKFLLSAPVPTDATSFYRAVDPINELRKEVDLDVLSFSEANWNAIAQSDMVFMQRPYLPQQVQLASLAKQMGRPVWCDWDDLLSAVPTDNPTHQAYSSKPALDNLKECIKLSDVITTSTQMLADELKKLTETKAKFVVVPNGLNMRYFERKPDALPTSPYIVWRGSPTHIRDLQEYQDAIMQVYNEAPEYNWMFMGFNPWFLTEKMDSKSVVIHGWVGGAIELCKNLQSVRGAIHITPLHDSPFNRAKSRISELESSLAGSVCLGPDWEEWSTPNYPRYKDKRSFMVALRELVKTPRKELYEKNKAQWEWILENRTLAKTNLIRKGIIEDFLGSRYVRKQYSS